MTNAEKKRILWSYRRIEEQLKDDYAELDDIVTFIKSPAFDGLPSTPNGEKDLADILIRKEKVLARIWKDIEQKQAARERINAALYAMQSEKERTLLVLRYKKGLTFEKVAEEMDYSWRHTLRLHGSALAHFEVDR